MTTTATTPPRQRNIPIVCPGHTRPLAEVQFYHQVEEDRVLLLSACHDSKPMLRNGVNGDWIGTFLGHKGAVWSCHMDPTCSLAATASGDFSTKLFDAITGQELAALPHKHIVKSVDFSPDSKHLATGGHEGLLRIFDLAQLLLLGTGAGAAAGATTDKNNQHPHTEPCQTLSVGATQNVADTHKHKACPITKITWINHQELLVGCADGRILHWHLATQKIMYTIQASDKGQEIRDMEISRNQRILSVATGQQVIFYDLESLTQRQQTNIVKQYDMPIHFREEGGVSLHPNGKSFVVGGSDLWVRVYDFESGKELEVLKGHHGPIRCVRYSPKGDCFATGSEDGTIRLWKSQ